MKKLTLSKLDCGFFNELLQLYKEGVTDISWTTFGFKSILEADDDKIIVTIK